MIIIAFIIMGIVIFGLLLITFKHDWHGIRIAFLKWHHDQKKIARSVIDWIGIAILFPIIYNLILQQPVGMIENIIYTILGALIIYITICAIAFTAGLTFLNHHHPFKNSKYIIVLGAGLKHGNQIPEMLAERMKMGIKCFNEVKKSHGAAPILICSGGQGHDETLPESYAMKQFAINHGINASNIIAEDQSKNTYQNMQFSRVIIKKLHFPIQQGIFVSSKFHILRSYLYARKVNLKINGVGVPTNALFTPYATIREFIALMIHYQLFNLIMLLVIIITTCLIKII